MSVLYIKGPSGCLSSGGGRARGLVFFLDRWRVAPSLGHGGITGRGNAAAAADVLAALDEPAQRVPLGMLLAGPASRERYGDQPYGQRYDDDHAKDHDPGGCS